jgi:hypothetical protein
VDTLAAVSLSGFGDQVMSAWDELEAAGGLEALGVPEAELGLDLPDDLRTLLGTDLAFAAFGHVNAPSIGARVVTEDGERAIDIINGLPVPPDVGSQVVPAPVHDGYVVASDRDTAFELVDDGGLGESEAFQNAVADPDEAIAIGYVNLAAVIEQLIDQGGQTAEDAAKFSAVEALGFSATNTDEGGRFIVRLTVR